MSVLAFVVSDTDQMATASKRQDFTIDASETPI
jgi:hypothetical protein